MAASNGLYPIMDWRIPMENRMFNRSGDGKALSYSPDGTLLAVRHDTWRNGESLRILDSKSGQVVHDIVELK